MVGWHHHFDEHEFEQALGVGDGQGSLACCSPWGRTESDTTEQLNRTTGFTESYLCGEKTSQIWCHKCCECGSYFWDFVLFLKLHFLRQFQIYRITAKILQSYHIPSVYMCVCVCARVHARSFVQLSPTLCDLMDSPLGSSVRGILQAGIPEWVAISPTQGSG